MQEDQQTIPAASDPSRSLRLVWLIAIGALVARVVYLVWFCRYELVEDEAQYWLWSKYPAWSYTTKGPGVAWAIWLSTRFFGDAEWAVRLPTAIASAIGALAVGALARDLAADARDRAIREDERVEAADGWATPAMVGALSALAYVLAPALQGAAIVMTIDGPYVACWAVAAWAFWRGKSAQREAHSSELKVQSSNDADSWLGWHWALLGAAIAIGFLFKYTMLLLVPGLIAFVLLRHREPGERRWKFASGGERGWFAFGLVLALLGLVPVIVWNAQNGWVTVRHLLGHLGLRAGDVPIAPDEKSHWSPFWLPKLIGLQIGMVGPWLILAVLAWTATRPGVTWFDDPRRVGRRFLICCAAPIVLFYAVVALIAEPEGNWPMAAHVTLLPLAAWGAADALAERRARRDAGGERLHGAARWRVLLWNIGLGYSIVAVAAVHEADKIGDIALALNRQEWFHSLFVRIMHREPGDPAGRVRGGREVAMHVSELLHGLEDRTGKQGFVLCQHYGRASQIAYYIPARFTPAEASTDAGSHSSMRKEKPLVLCAMHETGGRKSQFDYWEHTRLDQPALMGHPAVVVSSTKPEIYWAFKRMFDEFEELPGGQRLRGETKADRSAYLGIGYKGPEEARRAALEGKGAGEPSAPQAPGPSKP
jgi:4-amino-4-deoxy-L-arabinose transferase-like glycosyltransferase